MEVEWVYTQLEAWFDSDESKNRGEDPFSMMEARLPVNGVQGARFEQNECAAYAKDSFTSSHGKRQWGCLRLNASRKAT